MWASQFLNVVTQIEEALCTTTRPNAYSSVGANWEQEREGANRV